jgi:prepilin-type N-terminal cleavage/methylation domain-containing protein
MNRSRVVSGGFTLIELLIVVAIISILAAIAVPNFLEAQVHSKISRAAADMRTIVTALESYLVDSNHYPPNPPLGEGFYSTPAALSTPVAYLTSSPVDPFKISRHLAKETDPAFGGQDLFYDYYAIITPEEYIGIVTRTGKDVFVVCIDGSELMAAAGNRGALQKYGKWLLWSVGPDGEFWKAADDFNNPANASAGLKAPAHTPWGYSFDVPYDATNGTRSFGNVIRTQLKTDGAMPYF